MLAELIELRSLPEFTGGVRLKSECYLTEVKVCSNGILTPLWSSSISLCTLCNYKMRAGRGCRDIAGAGRQDLHGTDS